MTNLEKIQKACIKANPEIMELKFGCELKRPNSERNYKVIEDIGWGANTEKIWVSSVPFGSMQLPLEIEKARIEQKIKDHNGDIWQILGRPIRLADVLFAWELNAQRELIEKGKIPVPKKQMFGNIVLKYNLLDDNLEHQTPETIDFISSLL